MGDRKMNDSKNKFDQVRIITNPLSSNKNLDADGMIESILSKKQVFVKKSPNSFPLWLTPDSGKVPALYEEVWRAVQIPANPGFCNTAILSQILMTSGVTTQTLGYIWSLANKKCIGVLTEEELYLTMALIAISQNGTVIHDVEILKQVHEPIIPRLDLNMIKHFQNVHRFPQSHNMLPATVHLITQPTPPNPSMNNLPHSNFSSHSLSTISYPSECNKLDSSIPGSRYSSKPYQSETGMARENIAIQNISSMVQLQSEAKASMSYDWNNVPDDDEFTEFQSSAKPSASNVSITLNPIHYLMASSPTSSTNSNKKLNGSSSNNATPNLSTLPSNNGALNSNKSDSNSLIHSAVVAPNNITNHNKGTAAILSSLNKKGNSSTKVQPLSAIEDDEFTDFQSALDFDVQIKQPNLLGTIKTMIETKQPDKQTLVGKTSDEQIASVLMDNVPQKTKLEVLDTMSDERNTTMYSTQRDYSALKEIGPTSFFELSDDPTDSNVHDISKEMTKSIPNSGANYEASLFDIGIDLPTHENINETNLHFTNIKDNFKSSHDFGLNSTKQSSDLSLEKADILSLNSYEKRTTDKTSLSTISLPSAGINMSTANSLAVSTNDDYDDDFTDFKKAEPVKVNDDPNVIDISFEDATLVAHTKVLSNYDCLRDLNDENNLPIINSSVFERIQNQPESILQETKPPSLSTNTEFSSSFVDDNLFGSTDTSDDNIVSTFNAVNENDNEDDFSEFIHSTLNQIKGENENELNTHDTDSFTDFEQAPNITQDDDEFSNFEQAPKTSHIDEEFTSFEKASTKTEKTNDISSVTDVINKNSSQMDTLDSIDDLEKRDDDINEKHRGDVNNDKHRDKYSALRGLDFLDEDVSGKDSSECDTVSLQEDKERDISDGDNISLQLPCVETQEHGTIQSKCYEACIYTLETSLNLFRSNHIENAIVEHPKVIHHLKCLAEVYQVGKRLQRSGLIGNGHAKLHSTWNALSVYFSETTSFDININQTEQEVRSDSGASRQERCEICLSESIHLVEESNAKYHPQCINLYLNCVDSTPPPCISSVH